MTNININYLSFKDIFLNIFLLRVIKDGLIIVIERLCIYDGKIIIKQKSIVKNINGIKSKTY
jgi:hypothetical protein